MERRRDDCGKVWMYVHTWSGGEMVAGKLWTYVHTWSLRPVSLERAWLR
ncbi:hypothetical protein [Cohnella sp. OV330]|nr:hypothetical protein [Cohnella sp. OV330]